MRNAQRHLHQSASVLLLITVLAASALAPTAMATDLAKKVLVLGIDGMDPNLLLKYIHEGIMPNFARLKSEGDFSPLQTTMPPLSPVAWSTFITGMPPLGHGIFDFVHRKPDTLAPYLSMSEVLPPENVIKFGSWEIPLAGGAINLLRRGTAFWQILEEKGIPTTIFRMPANFPPAESPGKSFSGMGTPDLLGTPGTFQYFTNAPPPDWQNMEGGEVSRVRITNDTVTAKIIGPVNGLRRYPADPQPAGATETVYKNPDSEVELTVYLDRRNETAKISFNETELILKEGEWSDWTRIDFDMIPYVVGVNAVGRFYMQEVHPNFKLYLTPLQINPEEPAMPVSTPDSWASELNDALGPFYTQELPEDTKAFSGNIFSGEEFWEQSQFVFTERRRALDYFLDNFKEGLLFFYFSSVDQGSHMLWHYMDDQHPIFAIEGELDQGIKTLYEEMDEALSAVYEAIDDDTTLIVMSDHGFAPFYWGVNLNTWLLEKGYVTLKDPAKQGQQPLFANVDWSKTTAYAFGLNGLYINLKGREPNGIVERGDAYQKLLDQLEEDLLTMKDPRNGNNGVTLVIRTQRDGENENLNVAPDIIVGYNRGYRTTSESGLGEFPKEVFVDNEDEWSGDHSMDNRHVPGVFLTNKKITLDNPALYDLTVSVLDEYGIEPLPEMIGKDTIHEE